MACLPIPEKIETERLILERLKYEDAEEIFFCYASKPEATRYVSFKTHASVDDTRLFLKYAVQAWREGKDYTFSIRKRLNNQLVGTIGLVHDTGKIQVGYVLGPLHWNQGFASEACRKMMQLCHSLTQVYRVGSFVDAENAASAKVLRKSGMVEEARLEKWFRFVNQDDRPKDCILFRLPLNR